MLEDAEVKNFISEYKPHYPLLDIHNPVTYESVAFHDYYFECKRQQIEAMQCAKDVIRNWQKIRQNGGRGIWVLYLYANLKTLKLRLWRLARPAARVMVDQISHDKKGSKPDS